MFCKNCGNKLGDNSSFCNKCGNKTGTKELLLDGQGAFYSKEWISTGFYIASIPRYDILILKNNFYVLSFPRTYASTIGLILGLFIATLIGAIIGAFIGESRDKNKREKIRETWLDASGKLFSNEYSKYVFMQIPLADLKKALSIEGRQLGLKEKALRIAYSGKSVNLKYKKGEYGRVADFINKL